MPAPLSQRGLSEAVSDLTDRMPVPTKLVVESVDQALYPIQQRTAYFVISEALTNTVKHSQATRAEVSLERKDGKLVIAIEDDGAGGAAIETGTGLFGIRERLAVLGGTLTISSPSEGGTRVTAEVPL